MGYIFDTSKGETPETIKRQREIVRALMGAQRAPQNVGEGISALGDGIVANVLGRRADSAEKSGLESANAAMGPLAAMFGGGAEAASGTPAPSASAGGDPNSYREGIAGIESGGNYKAIGPVTRGDKPYGKYQVMGANVGPWTEQALGKRMSPEEFLSSPEAQDAVFDHIFGGYVKQYGPEGAAQAWFGGPGSVGKTGRKDVLGTDVGSYGKRFVASIGGGGATAPAAPTQVASLDPAAGLPPAQAPAGNQQAIIQALAEQGIPADSPQAQAFASLGAGQPQPVAPAAAAASNGIADLGPGKPGEKKKGPDGRTYQYVETTGMAGASGANGWIPVNDEAPMGGGVGAGEFPPAPGAQQQIVQALAQAPQQVAQADIGMGGGQGGGGFPAAPGGGGDRIQQLLAAAQNPYLSESQQAIVKALLGEEMQKRDPAYSLDLETKRAQIDKLKQPGKEWQKLDDDTLFNPASGETKELGVPGGPTKFEGTGLDAQAWNILQSADPSSKEYATAYAIVSQPKTQLVQTENGMMPVEVPPQLPAWLQAPGAAGGPVAAPGAAPAQPGADAGVPPVAPGNVIAGTKKPKTEAQGRNATITTILEGEIPTLNDNWGALADPAGQLLAKLPGGLGNMWQSEEFQRAAYSVSAGATNILYSLSGASSNPGEVLNQGRLLLPQFGDKPGAIADKLDRFKTYVKGVALQSGDQELVSSVNSALEKLTGKPSAKPAAAGAQVPDDTPPPASYTGKNWKYMTPEQRALWQ